MDLWAARLRDLLLCAGFALGVWAPLGRWILVRLGRGKLPENASLAIPIGMAAWGFWILALGLAGLLYRSVLLLTGAAAFFYLRLYRHLRPRDLEASNARPSARDGITILAAAGLSAAFIGIVLTSSLAPETNFDALNVHLPYARDAATTHRTGFDPNNWSSVMPALPLMSYITAFLFSGVSLARLFNALCYILSGGVIFFFARRWWGKAPSAMAALVFWSCPVAVFEATTALIDLPLVLFSSIAVFALLEWTVDCEEPYLWLSAAALGLAAGCKYHAAFWIAPLLITIAWRARKGINAGPPLTRMVLPCLRYLCIVGILCLPWLVRAWVYTGNPFFPAANGYFKSPYFTPAMEQAAVAAYANEGIGTSARALFQLPWMVTFHPGPFRGTPGFILLGGTILALLRCRGARIRYGLLFAGAYFYTWAFTAQDIRYLLPAVPLLALISVAGFLGLAGAPAMHGSPGFAPATIWKRAAHYAGLILLLAGSALALPGLYPKLVKEWTYWHAYQSPLNYLLGRQSAQDFLRRDVPSIYVYDYINANLGGRDRVLLLNDASRFYSRIPTLYSFTVEAERLLFEESEDGILRRLKESRLSHVLLNYNGIAPIPGVAPRRGAYLFLDRSFQEKHLEPLYSNNNVTLFRIRGR